MIFERFHARKEKNAMDLHNQRVLMKLILFHCLANTSDETPLPLPLVIENDDTLLEKKKPYNFRLGSWGLGLEHSVVIGDEENLRKL